MEQFVLGIFQEQLSKFLVGFKKEQVNANLLNGKGEIRDVNLNCSFINDLLCRLTPHIVLEEIRVSKLGFNVTSWTNIKKAPIIVDIEDVFVTIVEPLSYADGSSRLTMKQLSSSEFKELMKDVKPRGTYNLFDRILDNLQVEIRSVNISFQTRGKFKTQREGPWTPPRLLMTLRHLKYCSVNEFGNEATPEECWRHNRFNDNPNQRALLIYKKASMQVTMGFANPGQPDDRLPPLMRDAQVEVHIAFRKKWTNADILAVQIDATMNRVEIQLDKETIPVLAHAIAGMQYCFAKDRAFDDPLLSGITNEANDTSVEVAVNSPTSQNQETFQTGFGEIHIAELDEGVKAMILDEGAESVDGSKSIATEGDEEDKGEDGSKISRSDSQVSKTSMASNTGAPKQRKSKDRPIIILPSGIAIHQKVSVSLSIHDCKIRGMYAKDAGYIQVHVKGLVTEGIWPKVTREKGGYVQMSLSFVTIEEKFGVKITTMLQGGVHEDSRSHPIESPSEPKRLIPPDENFPLFEDRGIRPDPVDLRHSFPAQALGVKATIHFVDKVADPELEEIMVMNEVGVDLFDITLDSGAWSRAIRFGMNEGGSGFDPRWHSGDWTEELRTEMLLHPSQPLVLADHLQTASVMFLDENKLISSDLFNMTARMSKISVKVPAAIEQDVRSCDVVLSLGEIMLIVSSALPRTFLTGKIGSSVFGDGTPDPQIDFPNDPSDICYALRMVEDPLIRQQGIETSRRVSTFRAQLTTRDIALRTVPIIPFCDAQKPRDLLAPLEMTAIFCFEGEPPETPDDDLIKIVVFQSIQIHSLEVNCDFDMITGAISSLLFHAKAVDETIEGIKKLPTPLPPKVDVVVKNEDTDDSGNEMRILSTIGGRRVLVKKQLERSRETGGLSIEFNVQIAEVRFNVWRQNVPLNSRFRASVTENREGVDESPIPLLKLCQVLLKDIEIGAEATVQQPHRRLVFKSCISGLQIETCDFDKVSARHLEELEKGQNEATIVGAREILHNDEREQESSQPTPTEGDQMPQPDNTEANQETLSHATEIFPTASELEGKEKATEPEKERVDEMVSLVNIGVETEKDITIRLEHRSDEQQSISVAADLDVGGTITLHVHEIEMLFLLLVEALLLPTEVKGATSGPDGPARIQFPDGSIGALLVALTRSAPVEKKPKAPKVDVRKIATESDNLDELMHALILGVLPENIGEVLVRFIVGNLLVFVPHHSVSENDVQRAPWLGHKLRQASILSAYLGSESNSVKDALAQRLGKTGSTWTSLFGDQEIGFHHKVTTSQGLCSAEIEASDVVLKNTLIDSFDVELTYGPRTIDLSVGDSTLSLQDLANMRDLHASFRAFVKRFELMVHRIQSVSAALVKRRVKEANLPSEREPSQAPIVSTADVVEDAEHSLQRGRHALERLKHALELHDADMRSKLRRKEEEIGRLRVQVFLKERSRVAALALVSCQAAGWLRLGGVHMHGERTPSTASMWRYHAVLRKSLLIFYSGPGKPRPLDVVSLQGARLLTLAGGRKKRDVKNGFAIRERSGCIRYVLAPSDPELEIWIRELQKAIKDFSDDGMLEEDGDFVAEDLSDVPENVDISVDSTRVRARTLSSDIEGYNDDLAHEVPTPRRASHIREKFSKVSASTKSSIGTAVQAAKERRQKGRDQNDSDDDLSDGAPTSSAGLEPSDRSELQMPSMDQVSPNLSPDRNIPDNNQADHVKSPHQVASESVTADSLVDSVSQQQGADDTDDVTSPVPSGKKFSNLRSNAKSRFGSAVRGAREKALAVAEERRRQKQERESNMEGTAVGLRGRFENAATSVINRSTHGETTTPTASSHGTEQLQAEQQAKQFSDDSSPSLQDEPGAGEGVVVPETSTETEQLVDEQLEVLEVVDDGQDNRPKAGSQIRDKFSKFGAVMKNAAQAKKEARAISGEEEGTKSSRFSIRRKPSNVLPQESDLLKLKGLRIAGGFKSAAIDDEAGMNGAPPLARIKGCWIAHVQSQVEALPAKALVSERLQTADATVTEDIVAETSGRESSTIESDSQLGSTGSDEVLVASPSQDSSDQNQQQRKYVYSVRVLSQDPETQTKISVFNKNHDFQDVIGLFVDIMESVSEMPMHEPLKSPDELRDAAAGMEEGLASSLGIAPIDIVKLTGNLLGGLLSASSSFHSIAAYHKYQCEVLGEFLNAALTCLMPIDGCTALLEFLSIPGAISMDMGIDESNELSVPLNMPSTSEDSITIARSSEIISLTSACLSHLLRAEASGFLAQTLAQPKAPAPALEKKLRRSESVPTPAPFLDPLLPSSISGRLRDAMHSALNSIMKERDEAHAQLIATNVLHVHEMENERKQSELVRRKLHLAVEQSKRQQGLFAERFRDPAARDLQKYLENMVKNSDSEITKLCRELAKEVSEKTEKNLENYRLQESQKIVRETDAAEKQALEDELRKARELLREANKKAEAAELEARRLQEELDKGKHDSNK